MSSLVELNKYHEELKEIISINPATEEELGRFVLGGQKEIDDVLSKSKAALKHWANTPLKTRLKYLSNLSTMILEQVDEISELIAREQGKTVTEAKLAEILPVLSVIRSVKREAKKMLKPTRASHDQILFSHKKSNYHFVPYGVVVVISPWNYPFSVPVPEIVAALAGGNCVVFKPAPGTVLIGQKIDELFKLAGFPDGVLNTICIADENASYLVGHEKTDKIIFTGSTVTGKKVMCTAAEQISPVLLELGGKDPAIVAADADIKRAAKGIVWGAFFNAGQVCASIERVYVEQSVADLFIEECRKIAVKLKVGSPFDETTDVGPLENRRQLDLVINQVNDAKQKGARIICGGSRIGDKGFFFAPTILSNVDHSMFVMTEETFGPVLPIMTVDSLENAIRLANDSIFGLSAYGWTSSQSIAKKMQDELEAGTVMINDATASWGEPNAPWGGMKKSGIGRTRARFGLMEMVQVKYTSYDKGGNKTNIWWFPYDKSTREIANQAILLLFANSLWGKIRSLFRLIGLKRFVTNVRWVSVLGNLRKLF